MLVVGYRRNVGPKVFHVDRTGERVWAGFDNFDLLHDELESVG